MLYIINNKAILNDMGQKSLEIIKEWSFKKICDAIEETVNAKQIVKK